MKIQKSVPRLIAQALAASALVFLCTTAHAEPGCPKGACAIPALRPATAVAPMVNPVAKAQLWVAPREVSLRELISKWAATAGWQEPVWKLKPDEDFTLGASFEHTGELADALPALFDAFPPEFKLHVRMFAANRLIVVEQTYD